MFIREETPGDYEAIRAVNDMAFGRPSEGRLVELLRKDGYIVCSLVAVVDDRVVGNVVFSNLPIRTAYGEIDAVSLAPIAVMPVNQARGVGIALIEEGLEICKHCGKRAVLVLGDPKYYQRFGFSSALAMNIKSPFLGPSWMALELVSDALRDVEGSVTFPEAFAEVD